MDRDNSEDLKHLIDECATLERNCRIQAEAQFHMASVGERKNLYLVILPAVTAAVLGFFSAAGLFADWRRLLEALSGLAGSMVAVSTIIGIDRRVSAHTRAGNVMTRLRHEARFLHDTLWRELSREDFCGEARRIKDQYGELVQLLPMTTESAFRKAISEEGHRKRRRRLDRETGEKPEV